ncbi:MAG: hypothetical protein HPY58_08740 [Firmicutes bacterium]|nr:hypothetical protein [Bacillota bacterium]
MEKDKHVLPDTDDTFAARVRRTAGDTERGTIYGPDNEPLTRVGVETAREITPGRAAPGREAAPGRDTGTRDVETAREITPGRDARRDAETAREVTPTRVDVDRETPVGPGRAR